MTSSACDPMKGNVGSVDIECAYMQLGPQTGYMAKRKQAALEKATKNPEYQLPGYHAEHRVSCKRFQSMISVNNTPVDILPTDIQITNDIPRVAQFGQAQSPRLWFQSKKNKSSN